MSRITPPIAEGRCVLWSVNVRALDEANQGEDEDWAREVRGVGGQLVGTRLSAAVRAGQMA